MYKSIISLGFNIIGNIWANVSTLYNIINNTGLVGLRQCNEEMVHIMPFIKVLRINYYIIHSCHILLNGY